MAKGYYLLQAFYYSEDIGPDDLFMKEYAFYRDDNEKDAVLPLIARLLEMTYTGVKWTDISIKRGDLSKAKKLPQKTELSSVYGTQCYDSAEEVLKEIRS